MVFDIVTIILPSIYSSSLMCLLGMILCRPIISNKELDKKQYQPINKEYNDEIDNDGKNEDNDFDNKIKNDKDIDIIDSINNIENKEEDYIDNKITIDEDDYVIEFECDNDIKL